MPDGPETPQLLIVTGAHLRAEVADRPIAYDLQGTFFMRLLEQAMNDEANRDMEDPVFESDPEHLIVVCSDIWYLNNDHLRALPTIAIGHPDVNALTAHLVPRLPTAFVIDGRCSVQLDPQLTDAVAACWGADPAGTAQAVKAFTDRYLDAFIERAFE